MINGARGKGQGARGQSIVEYLVVAGAVITAILLIGPTFKDRVNNFYQNAVNKVRTGF